MSSSEAKLFLSLTDGVFEISGSELFVSQQIENFKDIIVEALQSKRISNSVVEDTSIETIPLAAIHPSDVKSEEKSFPRVLHFEDKDVKIIKKMPGSSKAEKSVNTAMAYLWGKRKVGIDGVSFQEIRDLCENQGCLDSKNFSSALTGAREYIIVEGKKGSPSKICKLTWPGVERAEEFMKGLNGD